MQIEFMAVLDVIGAVSHCIPLALKALARRKEPDETDQRLAESVVAPDEEDETERSCVKDVPS